MSSLHLHLDKDCQNREPRVATLLNSATYWTREGQQNRNGIANTFLLFKMKEKVLN